jgi:hypothetical protein
MVRKQTFLSFPQADIFFSSENFHVHADKRKWLCTWKFIYTVQKNIYTVYKFIYTVQKNIYTVYKFIYTVYKFIYTVYKFIYTVYKFIYVVYKFIYVVYKFTGIRTAIFRFLLKRKRIAIIETKNIMKPFIKI